VLSARVHTTAVKSIRYVVCNGFCNGFKVVLKDVHQRTALLDLACLNAVMLLVLATHLVYNLSSQAE
jgi:hypothetical protein